MTTRRTVIIGKIGSAHGVKGWLKINSYTDPPENILNYQPWLLLKNQQIQPVSVLAKQYHGERLVVQLNGCDDRDKAQSYTGFPIAVYREQLPTLPAGEYYQTDLEGLEVITQEQKSLGKVEEVLETGSNDVLVVQGAKRMLIPFLPDQVVLKVDLEQRIIVVNWDPDF